MITKFIKYFIVLFAAAALLPGCKKWLEVEPEYEVTDKDLFKNTEGYYKSLNGIYQALSNYDLYGMNLSWGHIEAWSHTYNVTATEHPAFWALYNREYSSTNAVSLANGFWGMYTLIAQTNDLIAHTEEAGVEFFKNDEIDYNVILGEAYALRGFMHFELARLFAKAPMLDANGSYIPYVNTYPSKVNPPLPTSTVLAKAIEDMKKGRDMVATLDLSTAYGDYMFSVLNRYSDKSYPQKLGSFYSNRGCRLNYLAITTLLARANMYAGNTTDADTYAKEIVAFVDNNKLAFTPANDLLSDKKMTNDLLFAFYKQKLIETVKPYYTINASNDKSLKIDDRTLRETNEALITDKRDYQVKNSVLLKYAETTNTHLDRIIPNIRISEAYYIAAECAYKSGDMTTAVGYLNKVRSARGVTDVLQPNTSDAEFKEVLTREYRKEFVGEGQLIFYFKRLDIPIKCSEGSVYHNGNLSLTVPDSESAS